eukprot:4452961-Amphidinium_carterae.1
MAGAAGLVLYKGQSTMQICNVLLGNPRFGSTYFSRGDLVHAKTLAASRNSNDVRSAPFH